MMSKIMGLNEEQRKVLAGLVEAAVSKVVFDYLEGLSKEETPGNTRYWLTTQQASWILKKAKNAIAAQPSLRLGQAIYNNLPPMMYNYHTGTDLDFFYWEEDHKVMETFLREYVSND